MILKILEDQYIENIKCFILNLIYFLYHIYQFKEYFYF